MIQLGTGNSRDALIAPVAHICRLYIWPRSSGPSSRTKKPALATLVQIVGLAIFCFHSEPAVGAGTDVSIPSSKSRQLVLTGKLFRPEVTSPAPAVILMHGCSGMLPDVTRSLNSYARFLTRQGFVVLNLDSFGPRRLNGGRVCSSYRLLADARRYRAIDAFDALRYLRTQAFVKPESIFLLGQSNGGSAAMIAATNNLKARNLGAEPGFRGVVALYPWCGAISSTSAELAAPLLVLAGAQDNWVSSKECEKLEQRLPALSVVVFEGAKHSFDVPVQPHVYQGKSVGYNADAAKQAKAEISRFFRSRM